MGAHIINDVSGGNLDDQMFKTVGELKVPYVLMHMQGNPQNMQNKPTYEHVVAEILEDLGKKTYELGELWCERCHCRSWVWVWKNS